MRRANKFEERIQGWQGNKERRGNERSSVNKTNKKKHSEEKAKETVANGEAKRRGGKRDEDSN